MQIGSAGGGHGDNHSSGLAVPGRGWVLTSDAAGPVDDYRTHAGLLTFFVAERIETMRFAYLSWALERGERRAGNSETSA